MIGGYTWNAVVHSAQKRIDLSVYLYVSGTRTIKLPDDQTAIVTMSSEMPWNGVTRWELNAPAGWSWRVNLPSPAYAENVKVNTATTKSGGFLRMDVPATASLEQSFSLPVRLLAPHPSSGQDTLTVSRGPLIYGAEAIDNEAIEEAFPHFDGVGLESTTTFAEREIDILGFKVIQLLANEPACGLDDTHTTEAYRVVNRNKPARSWKKSDRGLIFTPWFARANRGDCSHIRTSMLRVG